MVELSVSSERKPLSDEQLARESQAGSLEAFEELVSRYQQRVFGFVFRSCSCAGDAREITQDTFVKAYQALGQYDPTKPFAAWLFTIARRKCIDRHRSAPLEEAAPVPDEPELDDPAELLARREEGDALWECARRLLPEIQFQALWLRYAEEMSVQQVAQVLRRTRTHVKVLLFRARRRLMGEVQGSGCIRAAASSNSLHKSCASDKQPPAHQPTAARAHTSVAAKPWNPAPSIRSL
jgi:RNA polymerase sigma-70 factor (ECF subfamily)